MPNPQRTCLGCRRTADQNDLLRLTLDPANVAVVVDERRILGGRGAYLHRHSACIAQAIRRRAAPRALRSTDCDTSVLTALVSAYAKSVDSA